MANITVGGTAIQGHDYQIYAASEWIKGKGYYHEISSNHPTVTVNGIVSNLKARGVIS